MTLMEKLEALTPERQKKFGGIAAEQELDAFLDEIGAGLTNEEKTTAWKYIQARQAKPVGKTELADEELDNVAGGGCGGGNKSPTYQEKAAAEGRMIHVPIDSGFWFCELDSQLCGCAKRGESVYAKSKGNVPTGIGYTDCKCYQCNKMWRIIGGSV